LSLINVSASILEPVQCWRHLLWFFILFFLATSSPVEAQHPYFDKQKKKCAQESMQNDVRCLEFRAGMARLENFDEEKGNRIAEQLYKKALSIKPDDLSVLHNLASLYAQQKRYHEALELYQRFIAIRPSNLVIQMYVCILKERVSFPRREYMNCYKLVVQGYRYQKKTTGLDFVYAMILADEPGADRLKHIYIDSLELGSRKREMRERSLRNADRTKILDRIIP
jgi:tetratricopeptide (TPR) repeat protein